MLQKRNLRRSIALIVALVTVIVLLFSVFFLVEHADHTCTDSDCPICAMMELYAHNLKQIGTAILIACASVFLFMSVLKENHPKMKVFFGKSLITQKVRMND